MSAPAVTIVYYSLSVHFDLENKVWITKARHPPNVIFKGFYSNWFTPSFFLIFTISLRDTLKVTKKIQYVTHSLWYCWNYKGFYLIFRWHISPTHQSAAAFSHTVRVKLRAKRGHFDYSSKMTRFTQSSPHFGCKLNVSLGLESWVGSLSEYQYAVAIPPYLCCNPAGPFFNDIKSNRGFALQRIHPAPARTLMYAKWNPQLVNSCHGEWTHSSR